MLYKYNIIPNMSPVCMINNTQKNRIVFINSQSIESLQVRAVTRTITLNSRRRFGS